MMSIEQNWKILNEREDATLSELLRPGSLSKLHSTDPLRQLRRSLVFNTGWAVLIAIFYCFVLYRFPHWQILVSIGFVQFFTIWAALQTFLQYKRIGKSKKEVYSLLAEMELHYASITNWMKLQQKVALFVYPVAATGGFMIGGMLGSGKSIGDLMNKPVIIPLLLIIIAVLVPICFFLAKWMFKRSFGRHLDMMKKNIEELKAEY